MTDHNTTAGITNTTASIKTSKLELMVKDGLLTITDRVSGQNILTDTYAQVVLTNGTVVTTQGATCRQKGATIVVETPSTIRTPAITWTISVKQGNSIQLQLRMETQTNSPPTQIDRLESLVAPSGFMNQPLQNLKISQTGWQSWHVATPPVLPDLDQIPLLHPNAYAHHVYPLPRSDGKMKYVPADMSILHYENYRMLAGFIRAEAATSMIMLTLEESQHMLNAASFFEDITVYAGCALEAEPLLLIWDMTDDKALSAYALALSQNMQARTPQESIATGWCSWYYYYDKITEKSLLENVERLRILKPQIPIEYVQLDDGYMTQVGDWTTINEKFPSGMEYLADTVRQAGFRPGIWIAPFIVNSESEIYKAHPDWTIPEKALVVLPEYRGMNYFLDLTNPAVLDHIRSTIRTFVDEWGFELLKIDFLYAGAVPARRHDPQKTSIQAYRQGMQAVREAAGEALLLGCGAPLSASVGMVDYMRVSPDTAPYWRYPEERNGTHPSLRNAICSTMGRGWMQGRLWGNDPEVLMVRSIDEPQTTATGSSVLDWINDPSLERDDGNSTQLTAAEVRTSASAITLSGGMVLISEDMNKLTADELAIIPRLLPASGVAAVPMPHSFTRGKADNMKLHLPERPDWIVAALFNWQLTPLTARFDPGQWELPWQGQCHLYDTWQQKYLGLFDGTVELGEIAGHDVRLLSVRTVVNHPQVVGCSLHLLGGMISLTETWHGNQLTVQLEYPGERSGLLTIYVPHGFTTDAGTVSDNIVELPLQFTDKLELTLNFQNR